MDGMKMSNSFWIRQLKRNLSLLAKKLKSESADFQRLQFLKIAYVGVGSELNGDDAAGLWVVRGLAPLLKDKPHLLCLDSGINPENAIGPLRKFAPEAVVIIDAADMGQAAGSVQFIESGRVDGINFSTHSLPMNMIGDYLESELNCAVWLLGIQPAGLEFGEPLTGVVENTVKEIVVELAKISMENTGKGNDTNND